jgi:hypothetical protein
MSECNENLPPKPLRRVDIMFNNNWVSSSLAWGIPKGEARGFVNRHMMDYPCKPIRIVSFNGEVEFESKGNGAVTINYSNDKGKR